MKRLLPFLVLASTTLAQNPAPPAATPPPPPPPKPQLLRTVPPPGIAITSADRAELSAGVAALGKEIASLEKDLAGKPELLALLPDVQIFHKAVDWALRYDEFFSPGEVAKARQQLEMGMQRAAELRKGQASWNATSGADGKESADYIIFNHPEKKGETLPALVVRGYKSKIDGSIQPYGVVLPKDYKPGDNKLRPLHFWCHGRGEKLSELDFINGRLTNWGEYTPPGAFVIHLYGRYCCANKFAGEVDLFEAMENAAQRYPIDPARLVVRGFSMGGASAWQFGTHFAGMWACVQPGAGFGESKEFLKLGTAPDRPMPPEWEQKLWRWYDSTGYVSNLANTTTVAYSGEIDGQKQAADIMIRFARQEGSAGAPPVGSGAPAGTPAATASAPPAPGSSAGAPKTTGGAPALPGVAPGDGSPKAEDARVQGTGDITMYHVIAPNTPHKVVEPAKTEVEKLVEAAVEKGREHFPKHVRFTTYSLIYPQMEWLRIVGMEKQWERADVDAKVQGDKLSISTKNVSGLLLAGPFGEGLAEADRVKKAVIDGQEVAVQQSKAGVRFQKEGGRWQPGPIAERPNTLLKSEFTCGPIDHAFMSSFVFVRPSGKPLNKVVGDWVESELGHAVAQWRAVFRGDARVVADTAVSADDIANSNLILWGDPSSNAVLKKLLAAGEGAAPSAPEREAAGHGRDGARPSSALASILKWDGKSLVFAGKTYDATHIAPILIFPNPLNPQHYVVLNSGFTMREAAALNNAQQTPKLPDWAIVDLNSPPDAYQPGKILRAGFFDEQWQPPAP